MRTAEFLQDRPAEHDTRAAEMYPGNVLLDKFQIERVLGREGMGLVVAASHVELDELFAIKVMLPEMLPDADATERFVREGH